MNGFMPTLRGVSMLLSVMALAAVFVAAFMLWSVHSVIGGLTASGVSATWGYARLVETFAFWLTTVSTIFLGSALVYRLDRAVARDMAKKGLGA
jgi:hypothetical protein